MPGPLYSRYVPKKVATSSNQNGEQSSPSNAQSQPTQSYSDPLSNSKKSRSDSQSKQRNDPTSFEEAASSERLQSGTVNDESPKQELESSPATNKKRKRKDKKKDGESSKRRREEEEEEPIEVSEELSEPKSREEAVSEEEDEDRDTTEDTPRHKRKKQRKAQVEEQEAEPEDRKYSKKHQRVLSRYQKSIQHAAPATEHERQDEDRADVELHDLVPLPQPEQPAEPEYKPTFSALPPWLSRPDVVSSGDKQPFSSFNISTEQQVKLEEQGYTEAFAVQSAVVPLLLPGPRQHLGDVCVSAPTGSGKTLAYILPIIESLRDSVATKLRAVIVVPTRELVAQAKAVAGLCGRGTSLKVGIALGNQSFVLEQDALVKKGRRYDPKQYDELQQEAQRQLNTQGPRDHALIEEVASLLPGHVSTYESRIDILIATPGRLTDHIRATPGFNLRDLQWLVLDEADHLLEQSFASWTEVLLNAIESPTPRDAITAREHTLDHFGCQREPPKLTKVILSATMTRDLSKLSSLKFRRPKLLVVESTSEKISGENSEVNVHEKDGSSKAYELPSTLREYAMPVGDGSEKALVLLQLLQRKIFPTVANRERKEDVSTKIDASESGASTDSTDTTDDSDSDSSDASDSSDSSDPSDSSDSSSESSSADSMSEVGGSSKGQKEDLSSKDVVPVESTNQRKVLVFTKDNENASRLSHLLGLLHPPFSNKIATLTKSSTTAAGRKVLASFRSGRKSILIASDRASRGLDVPEVTHIVNYDIPRSVPDYVHRAGRTARAGRNGEVWTFITKMEGRWFWNTIAKGSELKRGPRKVGKEKPDFDAFTEEMKSAYTVALKQLRAAVQCSTR